jgi:hypothetical protein
MQVIRWNSRKIAGFFLLIKMVGDGEERKICEVLNNGGKT